MKNKLLRKVIIFVTAAVFAAVIAAAAALVVLQIRSSAIHDDYQQILTEKKYQQPVSVIREEYSFSRPIRGIDETKVSILDSAYIRFS